LAKRERGLFLVTGPTGSGKTTTQASIVDTLISSVGGVHIVTIEEPTEYRFAQRPGSIVTQREVPTNVPSFQEGLRQALRQDPDVIVVGEMRDLETTRTAISAAETGHVVFGTLHTVSAAKTIDRLIEQFRGLMVPG
jgi:twitching motility protein PilT